VSALATSAQSALAPVLPCYGDGSAGNRVQAIYAVPAGTVDRYATVAPSIERWAAEADAVFSGSARQTGGDRHIRFVTTSNCTLVVQKVNLTALGDDTFTNTMTELAAQGYDRTDRKYLVWMDSTVMCGIGGYYLDDQPGQDNVNNGLAPGSVARIDSGCWGLGSQGRSVEAHELMHTLGAVQPSAPNSTALGHCDDDADRMCYDDGSPGLVLRNVCPAENEALFDCNHDDYFSTFPPAGNYLATHWNTAVSSFLEPAPPPARTPAQFTALTPARVFDTRTGVGGRTGKLGNGASYDVTMTGRGGIPSRGVRGVLLNVTVTQGTAAGNLTVYPTGEARPAAPNLLYAAGQTRPVLVVVPVGINGEVRFTNFGSSTHVLADVTGWLDDGSAPNTARFSSLPPKRILDTRYGIGAPVGRVGSGKTLLLQATGRGGVPSTGVSGVLMNVTVTGPTATGYLTLYPTGGSRPLASQLNFVPNQTVPNLVFVATGGDGKVAIFNSAGATHVIADVVGWIDDGSLPAQSAFQPVVPAALLDTRSGAGGHLGPLGSGESFAFPANGRAGVPATGAAGVAVVVAALSPSAAGYLTVYPSGISRPLASVLNFLANQSAANVVVVPIGADGRVVVYNLAGRTDVRIDVVGYFDGG